MKKLSVPYISDNHVFPQQGETMKPHKVAGFVLLLGLGWLTVGPCAVSEADEADTHEGVVASAGNGKLSMMASDGKQLSYDIGETVKITVDGRMGRLEDLKVGARIRVTTDKNGRAMDVATIDSHKGPTASKAGLHIQARADLSK